MPQIILDLRQARGIRQLAEYDEVHDRGERLLHEGFDSVPSVVQAARIAVDQGDRGGIGDDAFEAFVDCRHGRGS